MANSFVQCASILLYLNVMAFIERHYFCSKAHLVLLTQIIHHHHHHHFTKPL